MSENPEYYIPGEKSSHKPPKASKKGVEATPVVRDNSMRGEEKKAGKDGEKIEAKDSPAFQLQQTWQENSWKLINDSSQRASATESAPDTSTSVPVGQPRRMNSKR